MKRDQRIRNIMVAHVQQFYNMQIKPNTMRKERELLKVLRNENEIIKIPADTGTTSVLDNVEECTKSEKSIL